MKKLFILSLLASISGLSFAETMTDETESQVESKVQSQVENNEQSFPVYTLGAVFNKQENKQFITEQNKNVVTVKLLKNNNYKIVTNSKNQITKITYYGLDPVNLKSTLGDYYESYHQAWLNRPNKYNHSSSVVETKDVKVELSSYGGKLYYDNFELKNSK